MNYERTTPNKRSRGKDTGFSKIKEKWHKSDKSLISLRCPYVVRKDSMNELLNNENFLEIIFSLKYQTRLRHQIVQKLDLSNTMDFTYHTIIQILDLSNKLKESFHSAGTDREILFTTIVLPRLLWPQPRQKCVQFKMDSWNLIKCIIHFDSCSSFSNTSMTLIPIVVSRLL